MVGLPMNRSSILILLLTSTINLIGCVKTHTAVCTAIPDTFITPQPFDTPEGYYMNIPDTCKPYAADVIRCKFNRLKDAEGMKAARFIDQKLRK